MRTKPTEGSINHEAVEAAAAAWVAKQDDAAAWTMDDEQELQAWLQQSTANTVTWLRMRGAWRRADRMREMPRQGERASHPAPQSGAMSKRTRRAWGLFAGVMVVSMVAFLADMTLRTPGEERYVTAVGARQDLTLADGSRVTLNTRTRARAIVNDQERKFWLEAGEAFFEIQHDPQHPFVVTAGKDRITVLGTKFSVRHEGGRTQVTVVDGRVKLEQASAPGQSPQSPPSTALLTRNESAVSQAGSMLVASKTEQQTQRQLSWREGRLDFENMLLPDIATEFNRYNRRQLVVHEDAASLMLSVKFEPHNVDGFVRMIQVGFGVVARTDGDKIHLSMN